jgi:hypothetical protein
MYLTIHKVLLLSRGGGRESNNQIYSGSLGNAVVQNSFSSLNLSKSDCFLWKMLVHQSQVMGPLVIA